VLIDSGVYALTSAHRRAHDMTMPEALALPPEAIDGFDELLRQYVQVVRQLGDRCWGYVELDQGGRDGKRATRARLEALGLRPIPVWHPLNDGAAYFDELASSYDRVCMGNLVHADRATRIRLLHQLLERRRDRYPHLWVHVLGLAPNPQLNGLWAAVDSIDASTWLECVRWHDVSDSAMLRPWSTLPAPFRYARGGRGDPERDDVKACRMGLFSTVVSQRGWRDWIERTREYV
jgi:hypothetical protein